MSLSVFVTAYFWLFLGFILAVVTWATVKTVVSSRARHSDFSLIKDWLAVVLRRGYEDAYLRLVHEPSGRFLHFRKYIRGKGDYGLEFRGFSSDWLESAWRKAQGMADDAGLSHRVEPAKSEDGSESSLIIDCGQDAAAAYGLAQSVWTGIFGLSLEVPYNATMDGWSPVNELIDGPDHPPPLHSFPPQEMLKEWNARLDKLGEPSTTAMLIGGIMIFVFSISGVGLSTAMLMSRGEAPDWILEFGTVSLGGSMASLVFLVVFMVSYWTMRRLLKSDKGKPRSMRWEKGMRILVRVMVITFPLAVVLAWAGL